MSSNAETKLLRELEPRGFLLLASWPWAIIACDRGDTLEIWRSPLPMPPSRDRYRFFGKMDRLSGHPGGSLSIKVLMHVAWMFSHSLEEPRDHMVLAGITHVHHVRPGLEHLRLEPMCGKNSAHYTMEDDLAHREFQKIIREHASSGSPEI